MKPNNIIFSDLSTYTPKKTMQFYENVFGWKFSNEYDYYTAYIGDMPIIGLYETPDKFKQMRMPHFWMTYIQVNDASKVITTAKALGGIIEMELGMTGFGKIALIRDPQGAGFTIYEGDYLNSTRSNSIPNALIWNELHVSDAQKVVPFYTKVFDWEIKRAGDFFKIGFAPRAKNIAVYAAAYNDNLDKKKEQLGKIKLGKSCIYINKLEQVNEELLEEILKESIEIIERRYPAD